MKTNQKNEKQSNSHTNGSGKTNQAPSYLQKFFINELKDIYYAEKELVSKGLPEMKKAATSEELEDAFDEHLRQTERQVKRLERIFQSLGKKAEGKKCEAMDGILKEAKTIINETEEGSMTRDAALIIAAQKVEHYEIATYGGLVALALTLGLDHAADLLEKTLHEEEETDQTLTDIAEQHINLDAEQEGDFELEEETEEVEA